MGQCAGQTPSRYHRVQPLPLLEEAPSRLPTANPPTEESGKNSCNSPIKLPKCRCLPNINESDENSSASWQSSHASIDSTKGTGQRESERMDVSRLQTLVPSEMKKHLKRKPLA